MKKFLLIGLTYLIALNPVFAATSAVNNVFQLGQPFTATTGVDAPSMIVPITDVANIKILSCGNTSTTADNYYGCANTMAPAATGLYQVTAGKILYCSGFYSSAAAQNVVVHWGYATATFTDATGSAPTGAVDYAPTTTTTSGGIFLDSASLRYNPFPVAFPTSSFPYVRFNATQRNNVVAICKEV